MTARARAIPAARGLRVTWAAWAAAAAVSCGASVKDGPPVGHDAGEASAYCPATLEQTNGHTCSSSGLMCTQDIACNELPQQVVCTCKSSRYECHDPIGLLPPGDTPRCLSNDPKKFYCPPSMAFAEGLTCTANGQSCFYDGAVCKDGVVRLNYCECAPDGLGGFAFGCHIVSCGPDLLDGGGLFGE